MFFFCFIFKRFIMFYAYLDWHFGCKVNCNHMQYSYTFKLQSTTEHKAK